MKNHSGVKIAIIGGDRRHLYLSETIASMGYETYHLFVPAAELAKTVKSGGYREALADCRGVILPIPVSRDGIRLNTPLWAEDVMMSECFQQIPPEATVLGGLVTPYVAATAAAAGLTITDLLETEALAVRNALPTAEGAVQIAMEETPITLFGANCVVVGYGRIGRLLAKMLHGLGARVTVTSRKSEHLTWVTMEGYQSCHTRRLLSLAPAGDIFFNTAPAPVLTKEVLAKMKPGALVIDLASPPGGTDFEAAKRLGIQAIHALSLPGRVAPKSAAAYIAQTATEILDQERMDLP